MSRVFAVQQPTTRGNRPTIDLSPAEKFGEVVYVFGPTAKPWSDTAPDLAELAGDFNAKEDFLLLVGNPVLIARAYNTVRTRWMPTVPIRLLQWSNGDYRVVEA